MDTKMDIMLKRQAFLARAMLELLNRSNPKNKKEWGTFEIFGRKMLVLKQFFFCSSVLPF